MSKPEATCIVRGAVFFNSPPPEEFLRGGTYNLECVFYTNTGERFTPSPCVLLSLQRDLHYMKVRPARSQISLPALRVETCELYTRAAIREMARRVARIASRHFGNITIDVLRQNATILDDRSCSWA